MSSRQLHKLRIKKGTHLHYVPFLKIVAERFPYASGTIWIIVTPSPPSLGVALVTFEMSG